MVSKDRGPPIEGPLDGGLLRIYLRDHLAAATGGVELARRTLGNNRGTEFEPVLKHLAKEIEEDRRTLLRIMRAMGVTAGVVKQAVVWALEKVARLKLNGELVKYSRLSRLVEFEALQSGIAGKRALWASLAEVADADPHLDPIELKRLEERATDQHSRLEAIRLLAARLALATG